MRIEGQYTKTSAIYMPALAKFLAKAFATALRRKRTEEDDIMKVDGIESVLCNDLLLSGDWNLEFAWHWRCPLKKLAKETGDIHPAGQQGSKVLSCKREELCSSTAPYAQKGSSLVDCGWTLSRAWFCP